MAQREKFSGIDSFAGPDSSMDIVEGGGFTLPGDQPETEESKLEDDLTATLGEVAAIDTTETGQQSRKAQAEESKAQKRLAKISLREMKTPDGQDTVVLVHKGATIGKNVTVGEGRGPIGASTVEDGCVIKGAVYDKVKLHKGVVIDNLARIGAPEADQELGEINIEEKARIGARTRILAPKADKSTTIGARAVIGKGAIIGDPIKFGARGKDIVIGEDVRLADGTIIQEGAVIGAGCIIEEGFTIHHTTVLPPRTGLKLNRPFRPGDDRILVTPKWLEENTRPAKNSSPKK